MQQQKRITQQDIAQQLGISRVTVSRALSGNPLVPKPLQERVREIAQQLGYTPDPALSCLNAYRQTRLPIEQGQTLGWIVGQQDTSQQSWFQGAKARAAHYGYRLRPFNPHEPNQTPRRTMEIIYNQGITGLIFDPREDPQSRLDINLDKFCAVAIGYSLKEPVIDRVITDHFLNCALIYETLYEKGYRRIGYAYAINSNRRLEGRELSAFIYQQKLHPDLVEIPPVSYPLIHTHDEMNAIMPPWIKKWKPEVIICSHVNALRVCRDMKLRIPEDISIVTPMRHRMDDERTGIDQLPYETGMLAVDTVVALLRSNQRGVPVKRRTIMISGVWVDGTTTRPPEAAATTAQTPATA